MIDFLLNSNFSSEYVSLLMVLVCSVLILISLRLMGLLGLYVYNVIAIIASNIQVLQISHFSMIEEPIALGTITFATTFLVSDIISEHYGKEAAQRGIVIYFAAQGMFSIMMMISSLYRPASGAENISSAVDLLFLPSWRIFLASIFSYSVSQYFDIAIFKGLKDATRGKMLWLRTMASTGISGFIDNFIFSYVAWVFLNPDPISMKSLFLTYIAGAYIGRLICNFVTIPVIYFSRYSIPK